MSLLLSACMEHRPDSHVEGQMEQHSMDHATSDESVAVETSGAAISHAHLVLQNIWGRPSLASGNGAAYLQIINQGEKDDRLIGAQTDMAQIVEIHEVKMQNNVMQMQMLTDGLVLPAGEQVELKPGGYHMMLIDLQHDLAVGSFYTMTLHFETSGEVEVAVEVLQP